MLQDELSRGGLPLVANLLDGPPVRIRNFPRVRYDATQVSHEHAVARLDVPVLALSQLRRGVEMRPSQRPLLSDLRESGSIEQDADVVMFIHREDMLHTEGDWERQHPDDPYPKGVTELIVAKHRHGPTGSVQLYFDQNTTTFRNASLAPTRSG